MADERPYRIGKTADETFQFMREAIRTNDLTLDEWAAWGLTTSLKIHDKNAKIEAHSAALVRLTWALIGLTTILAVLTAVWAVRTIVP